MEHSHHTFNIVGKAAHFFASNKPLSLLAFIGVIGFGLFAFALTPKQYNPEIVRPAFAITVSYAGATPEQAIDKVVYELVEKVSAVPGVDEVFTEVRDGAIIGTTVIFDVGYDATKAKVDLLSQLEQHSYLARGFITEPHVVEVNPETIPVLQVVFSSPTLSVEEVRRLVVELGRTLTDIPEVSDVHVVGGYEPSLVVEVDPMLLTAAGLTFADLRTALANGQTRLVVPGYDAGEMLVRVLLDARVTNPEEVGMLPVRDGVRVRDVARVYEGALPSRSYVLYDTRDSDPAEVVMLSVSKVEGSSAPVVTGVVRDVLTARLHDDAFTGLEHVVVSDDGVTASREIKGLAINLVQSITIVAAILLLFLSTRAAAVVLVAIPTTLLIVFGLGYVFDQTINRITLFALILSLGLLVDAAIVVVENMYVHLKRVTHDVAESTRAIIIAGSVNEIGVALFLSTVTSVVVFLPVRYITGMMGPYMGPIAFFVPAALVVSLLVAITVIPFIASYILHAEEKESRLTAWVRTSFDRIIRAYQQALRTIVTSVRMQRRVLVGAVGLLLVALVFPLTGLEHFQMLPRADRDQFYVYIDTPIDSATEHTRYITGRIADVITADPDVISVQQFIAQPPIVDFNGMFKGAQYRVGVHQASLRVNITPAGERDRSSTAVVTDVRTALTATHPGYAALTRFIEEPPGPPVRATLVAKISSDNAARTRAAVGALLPVVRGVPGVVDPYVSYEEQGGALRYVYDREQATRLGIEERDVAALFSLYGGGVTVTEYVGGTTAEYTPVVMVLPHAYRDVPSRVNELYVRTAEGSMLPVGTVVTPVYEPRNETLYLERSTELTYITGEVEKRPIIYVIIDVLQALASGAMEGYTVTDWGLVSLTLLAPDGETVTLAWGGEWEMTLENFRDLGIAMGVALALVYAVLVAQYRSFKKPAFIMITVPLGLIGILFGFLALDTFFGIYLTATALIGFIALVGIVVNNAIIFSEYIDQAEDQGASFEDALVEAGGARFRPIMLTSLTTILGSLTIVADPVWSGLAWAIVFGLSLSTVLTLIVYPTLLAYFRTPGE